MQDFRNLEVWARSHQLALSAYRATGNFPKEEQYGIKSQIRRSAVSIPSNLAEGCGRRGDAEFGRFVQISLGSASELEYQLLLSRDLGFLQDSDYRVLETEVVGTKKMLIALLQKLKPRQ